VAEFTQGRPVLPFSPDARTLAAGAGPLGRAPELFVSGLFSAFFALFMAEATDPVHGFLPVVVEPPPAHSEPRGFEASLGVSRLYARSAMDSPRTLVPNTGDYFAFPPQEGIASWYGYDHIGRKTADGGWFDPEAMTAAHRTLPFGTVVRVTRIKTGASVEVTINDRGPYIEGRIIDLARKPAYLLGLYDHGIAKCRVEVLKYPFDGPAPVRAVDVIARRDPAAPVPVKKAQPDLKLWVDPSSEETAVLAAASAR
jgi:rare lipoprotein A